MDFLDYAKKIADVFGHAFARSMTAYLVICGGAFVLVWILLRRRLASRRLQVRPVQRRQMLEEFKWSVITLATWAANSVVVAYLALTGRTTFYTEVETRGWPHLVLSFFILTVIQDTWFYWTHRAMHHPKLFKWIHATHHRFRNPSPWASFALSPLEAQIQYGYVYIVVLLVPVHPYVFAAVLPVYFSAIAILHLGYEIWPSWFPHRLITTSTNHNLHHQELNTNFAAAYTFWDWAMHTTSPNYDARFREITGAGGSSRSESSANAGCGDPSDERFPPTG